MYNESETLTKFEIMDGAPVKGESIPVRLFLGHFDLTPTYRNVHSKFSVKYYISLVLVDEEDLRYYKEQEITLWRRAPGRQAGVPHVASAANPLASPRAIAPPPHPAAAAAPAQPSAAAAAAATTTTTTTTTRQGAKSTEDEESDEEKQ